MTILPKVPRVLVLGGSYGGLSTVLNLVNLCDGKAQLKGALACPDLSGYKLRALPEISLLDERDGFYHLMGAPLNHLLRDAAQNSWIKFEDIDALRRPNIRVIKGRAVTLDTQSKILKYKDDQFEPIQTLEYDYLVLATGTRRAWPIAPQDSTKEGFLRQTDAFIGELQSAKRILVVGGGAVGIEFAGELKQYFPRTEVNLVHSRDKLLSSEPLPDLFRAKTLEKLQNLGVNVILGRRVVKTRHSAGVVLVELSGGDEIETDRVILSTAFNKPNVDFLPRAAIGDDGCLAVEPSLQLASAIHNAIDHFAVGDIVSYPHIKRAGGALYMGQVAATNIFLMMAAGRKEKLFEFPKFPAMMALAVGGDCVGYHGATGEVIEGKELYSLAFGKDLGLTVGLNYLGITSR